MSTIKQIAQKTGYSPSTVSIVLGGKAEERHISPATRNAILNAARELEYIPNLAARRLRDKSEATITVGVFWSTDSRAALIYEFLKGLRQYVIKSQLKIEITAYPFESGRLSSTAAFKSLSLFSAAIVCTPSDADLEYLEKSTFVLPIVLYNRESASYSTVQVDNYAMGAMAASIFLSHQKTKPALFALAADISVIKQRTAGFMETFLERDIKPLGFPAASPTIAGGYGCADAMLKSGYVPDCVFCLSDLLAFGAFKRFDEAGVKIPRDVELICIGTGDKELYDYSLIPLSTIEMPIEAMGEKCLELAVCSANGKISKPVACLLELNYFPRATCPG